MKAPAKRNRKVRRALKAAKVNWYAVAHRLQYIVELLSEAAKSGTVLLDYAAADRAIAYCNSRGDGAEENEAAEEALIDFVLSHNQSLDWIFCGDATMMICKLAAGTSSRQTPQLTLVK